ncbi:MAG: NEW3 domain-containing protein, partial [Methanothrix sp.]
MKRQIIWIMIIFFLTASLAEATVEDSGIASGEVSSSPWTESTSPTLPTFLPSPCSGDSGSLIVKIGITGPESEQEKLYTTPGKPLDFMVTISNDGMTEAEAQVGVKPDICPFEWFSWTTTSVTIPAGVSRSVALQVLPDTNAAAGEYRFAVEASAKCRSSEPCPATFKVQAFDYASETSVAGTGQFQIDKNLRSMNSGIKSTKSVMFSGSVDALMKNEYIVDEAKGKNANFQEQDAVDNYNAVSLGDALVGTESFK